ncbi:diguanylate cyclase domain-containing protein [Capilliphycus salinus ALCB114379]|uniref:diguanylate cyclase domain-containing protein n=1 Tax=Capilliphycus salinus TaxID=2768948 RepID=UPI0039A6A39D
MSENQTEHHKISILIVDDTPNNLRFLSSMLLEQGYEVRKAINGQMALRSAQAEPPDLILLDVRMPDMSGYEVCHALKAEGKTREIPVIFLSALNDEKDKVIAFEMGAVDYVTKPFQFQEVLARVKTHLTIQHQRLLLMEQKARLEQEVKARTETELALKKANQELHHLATIDSVTHVANRRRFDEYLNEQWQRLTLEKNGISIILCEIDEFNAYVKTNGDPSADECLRTVAWAICRPIKPAKNLVARYSDAKFGLILPQTTVAEAFRVAEQIRTEVAQLKLHHASAKESPYITLSLGVSSIIPSNKSQPKMLIENADRGLQEASTQGYNRTVIHQ